MKKYKYLLWDLDGTIIESGAGVVNSVTYALEHMGTPIPDIEVLQKFIGPPLLESFSKYFSYSRAEAEKAQNYFREYYQAKGIDECRIYKHIDELLERLVKAGYLNILATAKPEPHARNLLAKYGIDQYFHYIAGATFDETRARKEQVIAYALETCGISDKSQAVMIGDRSHDCIGARLNGLDCIGVLYGYGDRLELVDAGVVALAKNLTELGEMLLGE